MNFTSYLKSRSLYIGLIVGSNIIIAILLIAFEIPSFIMFSYYFMLLLFLGIFVLVEYTNKRRFYVKVTHLLNELDEKYLIAEMLPDPGFIEGGILNEILMQTGKSMTTNVSEHAQLMEEYRDYLEMWIHEVKTPIASARLIIDNDGSRVAKTVGDELDKVENYLTQALFYARSSNIEKDFVLKELDIKQVVG